MDTLMLIREFGQIITCAFIIIATLIWITLLNRVNNKTTKLTVEILDAHQKIGQLSGEVTMVKSFINMMLQVDRLRNEQNEKKEHEFN